MRALLVEVGARLARAVRPSDVVARLGGDEFAILVADVDAGDAGAMVKSIRNRVVAEIERPYEVNGQNVRITASIGTSTMHEGDDYESLLRRGDVAMYESKRLRRDHTSVGHD